MSNFLNPKYTHIAVNNDRSYCSNDDCDENDTVFWRSVGKRDLLISEATSYCPICLDELQDEQRKILKAAEEVLDDISKILVRRGKK